MQRMTPIRQAIIDVLKKKHLLSATQLLSILQATDPRLNKTTVYRSLDFLLAESHICRHTFSGDEAVYELRDHHHDHLVCTHCGSVTETDCKLHPPKAIDGFRIDHHHATYYGCCQVCLMGQNA